MASDLRAVMDATGSQPAVLVGHSIGGMINLTLCKENAGRPGSNVSGIVMPRERRVVSLPKDAA